MNIISLFDGVGGAAQALKNLGVEPSNYWAFETDTKAVAVAEKNQPGIRSPMNR